MQTPAQQPPAFTTFDAPSAGTGANQGTGARGINTAGTIAGNYTDASSVVHGFVRAADGTMTSFDGPGSSDTFVTGINAVGAITGYYQSLQGVGGAPVFYSFVRAADGTLTAFEAPGAGTRPRQGTQAMSINATGDVTGNYSGASGTAHGFVRAASGAIVAFDPPGSSQPWPKALTIPTLSRDSIPTQPVCITASCALPTAPSPRSMLRAQAQPPAWDAFSINAAGTIAGYYTNGDSVFHGFVRAASGAITTFDAPGAGTGSFQGTSAVSINAAGVIMGTTLT